MNQSTSNFDTAMRGYDRAAVDAKVAQLTDERIAFERRAAELEREMVRMRQSLENGESAPYYITLSRKMEGILREAHEDADRTKADAELAGQRERERAMSVAEELMGRTKDESDRREAETRAQIEGMINAARSEAERVRQEATDKAAQLVASTSDVVEKARIKGAQIATEVETKLTAQREQFERDTVSRQETAERRLAETAQMAEQMKAEAARMTEDSQRAAKALIEAARTAASELIAETTSRAERLQQDAERELAALTHRRDSINAQLSTVRETLSSLSGGALAK
ncbi:cellulose-binding protein [Sporichthya polymorpha]|uniref:cellulose-binding protein n=1 Tax=Sporichthya polymorpha TaxID=35751 RepID=UPI00146CEB3B|nr:cellulose-binding protein [Sporichthya polymorpha]